MRKDWNSSKYMLPLVPALAKVIPLLPKGTWVVSKLLRVGVSQAGKVMACWRWCWR